LPRIIQSTDLRAEGIRGDLHITPILDRIQKYRRNWLQNINRTLSNRLPRIIQSTDLRAEGIKGEH